MNMQHLPAYELIRKEELRDIKSVGYLLRHKKSGARIALIRNEDENKVFNIAFRTTPKDSTGVAHIMEHTVLCGSRLFPSKDPFVELAKGSMNTFLNAMTYPDKTMFPVASCNDADFANLMHVYLDAVFYPNIYKKEEIFRQEGWSYVLENEEDPLTYNGVVYNEMKGALSSADDMLDHEIMASLFPENTYFFESGGDPEDIPNLTYEDYLNFHKTYYHPSNSYIYLYGAMDFEERLNWLDKEYLSAFENEPVDSEIALQTPFTEMNVVTKPYPIAQEEETEENTYLSWNAVIGTSLDTRLASACAVLEYALLDAPGAPLKQALLDAGIGSDVMGSYDSGIRQPVFSVTSKFADPEDQDRFLQVIRETLKAQAENGVNALALKAAINSMEFKFREADYGSYPKGLMYGIDMFDTWLYDEDMPFAYLHQLNDFEFLREQIGTGYYEDLIRTCLLENTHTSLVLLVPERGLTAKMEENTRKKLEEKKASLTKEEIQEMIRRTEALRAFQETPSTQEELEKIPMLTREDLRTTALPFRNELIQRRDVRLLHHDYDTNGIIYMNLLLDASDIPEADLPYFGLLRSVLGMVNTEHYTYGDLYNEININTGGITPGISMFPDTKDNQNVKLALGIQVRALEDKTEYVFRMIEEILFTSKFDDDKRLLEIINRIRSRLESSLNSSGSATAATRCMSYFSLPYRINDHINGITFYRTLKDLSEHYEEKKADLKEKLQSILDQLLRRRLIISFTGSAVMLDKIGKHAESLAARLREEEGDSQEIRRYVGMERRVRNEGFKTSAKIQYVARCGNFREKGYEYTGALRVLRTIMSYEYLWSNVRVVGGAYGCSASFGRNGDTNFVSFRDPHLKRTLNVYEGIPAYLESFTVDQRDMTKYVIGTISEMDTPLNPSALGGRSCSAYLSGVTVELLQKEREQVLNASQEDIRALAPITQAALDSSCICVLGNEEKLEAESDLFGELTTL